MNLNRLIRDFLGIKTITINCRFYEKYISNSRGSCRKTSSLSSLVQCLYPALETNTAKLPILKYQPQKTTVIQSSKVVIVLPECCMQHPIHCLAQSQPNPTPTPTTIPTNSKPQHHPANISHFPSPLPLPLSRSQYPPNTNDSKNVIVAEKIPRHSCSEKVLSA